MVQIKNIIVYLQPNYYYHNKNKLLLFKKPLIFIENMTNFILLAIPFFLLFMLAEYLLGKKQSKNWYKWHDTVINLCVGIGSQAIGLLFKVVLLGGYFYVYENFALIHQSISWYSALFALVAFDFTYYWAHRWSHEVNIFWGAHIVHHQSEEYNLSVALRQSWVHNLLMFVLFLPLPLLGFEPVLFFSVAASVTLYQFWIHTQAVGKLPNWLEYIMNTPSHHRVHHATNNQYLDKNHGAVFIIWDRIFGSFCKEVETPVYGITTRFKSFNPTWANVEFYTQLWAAMKTQSNYWKKFKLLWARPDSLTPLLPNLVIENESVAPAYDKEVKPSLEFYATFQFVAILAGLVAYMTHFDSITLFYQWYFCAGLILSIMICGGILESKKWVRMAEYLRLVVVLIGLNSYYYFWYLDWLLIMAICSALGVLLSAVYFSIVWKQNLQETDMAV